VTHAHASGLAQTIVVWQVMMIVMMTPAVMPWLRAARRFGGRPADFAAGYFTVWLAYSTAAAIAQIALQREGLLMSAQLRAPLGAAALIAAGLFQLTPWKRACLAHCRSPIGYFLARWRSGPLHLVRLGAGHGWYCVACCWALMATTFAVGLMNVAWMIALTAIAAAEQHLPGGRRIAAGAGIAMAAWGIALVGSR
jgi:predicted metal-binding membrane protein